MCREVDAHLFPLEKIVGRSLKKFHTMPNYYNLICLCGSHILLSPFVHSWQQLHMLTVFGSS